MSEVQKNVKKEDEKKERVPYVVKVDPIEFTPDFSGKYLTSNEFCKLTNEFFRGCFADFIGSTFDIINGQPTVSLYFDHGEKSDPNQVYACERVDGKTYGNNIIDRTRSRDTKMRDGDRYQITDDGIDIIKGMLIPAYYNNGKPNWKSIVTDIVDKPSNYYQYQAAQQVTKVIAIDPRAICSVIYGKTEKDDNHSYLDYDVIVRSSLNRIIAGQNPIYILEIAKAFTDHIVKTYEKLGVGTIGSNIVR